MEQEKQYTKEDDYTGVILKPQPPIEKRTNLAELNEKLSTAQADYAADIKKADDFYLPIIQDIQEDIQSLINIGVMEAPVEEPVEDTPESEVENEPVEEPVVDPA